jgi:multisubunit Na+/H+ antiporter MnhE subunit
MSGLVNVYILCFAAGFLLDKFRIFPFIIGVIVGLVLKTLVDNNIPFNGAEVTEKFNRLYTKLVER